MQLDPDDRRDLARACARRFPGAEAQRRFAKELGMPLDPTSPGDPEAAWAIILDSAERKGALDRLARMLAAQSPADETFAALARTLGVIAAPPARPPWAMLGVGGVGAALMTVGLAAFFLGGEVEAEGPAAPVAAAALPVAPPVEAPAAGAPAVTEAAADPPPLTRPAAEPPPPVSAPAAASPRGRLRVGCTGAPAGEVVGYWYAGTKDPGPAGGTLTLQRDARVRADYPRAENHHDPATPERCVLTRGTRFVLSAAPIQVSPGHWWVPVIGGP
ncbi:MAG: hypothetical protein EXR71_10450 [Myxococcales bacterium]|nr:hypothetical protein [Myxococcales bacterium]